MNRSKVAIIRCSSYDESEVYKSVSRGIDLLGGLESFAGSSDKILLKPNILAGDIPEKCTTTHPAVFKAVGRLFLKLSRNILYGDSPGYPGKIESQMRKSGITEAAESLNIPLADFNNGCEVHCSETPFIKRFILARGVHQADCLISLPKFKTHGLTRITGAVKNQMGCIPGLLKAEYHVKMPDPHDFARMLVALNLVIKPRLYVMDGIIAMEGNGPRSGDPVKMNVLLFSRDPVALDAVMCRIIDLKPEFVPTMKPGKELGLGTYKMEEIELLGDSIDTFINPGFKVERRIPVNPTRWRLATSLKSMVSPRPVIKGSMCIRCGVCINICPVNPKALDWPDSEHVNAPIYNYNLCIRCFCCQEMCPEGAINIKTPVLGRFILRY